jgi:pimeloyl-ACP methyl ester carboxylesterase
MYPVQSRLRAVGSGYPAHWAGLPAIDAFFQNVTPVGVAPNDGVSRPTIARHLVGELVVGSLGSDDLPHCDREEFGMASISGRESREIEAVNASGTTPVVFIHGLWLLPSSWAKWADFFKQAGYAPLTPDWPDDPETVEAARANPDVLAKKTLKQVADHTAEVIGKLEKKPAVMGHSTGGLFAQMLAGRGLRQPRLRSIRACFAASCRCPSRRSKRVGLSC